MRRKILVDRLESLGRLYFEKTECPFYTHPYILNWYFGRVDSCFNLIYDLIKFVNINEEDYINIINFIIKYYEENNYITSKSVIIKINEFYNKYKFGDLYNEVLVRNILE